MVNQSNRLLTATGSLARRTYTHRKVRVWYTMLNQNTWRAFVIDPKHKVILCQSDLADSWQDAILQLKDRLEKDLAINA